MGKSGNGPVWEDCAHEGEVDARRNSTLQGPLVKNVNRGRKEVDQPKHNGRGRFKRERTGFAKRGGKNPETIHVFSLRFQQQRPLTEALWTCAVGGTVKIHQLQDAKVGSGGWEEEK